MGSYDYLSWSLEDGVATVTMNRPPVNAVDQQMYRELTAAFAPDGPVARSAKAIVLTGAGRHFCAGNDLGEFATLTPDNADSRMAEVRGAFFAIQDCPVPVIGAVRGAALGTGLAIAASCDFVIAAEGARFGTPEVGVGVMGGARHLARLVPEPWVRWMYLTAEPVTAEQLHRLGSLIAVAPDAELLGTARTHARLQPPQRCHPAHGQASAQRHRGDGPAERLRLRARTHTGAIRDAGFRGGAGGDAGAP